MMMIEASFDDNVRPKLGLRFRSDTSAGLLIAVLVAWLGGDLIVLWHFLGRATVWTDGVGAIVVVAMMAMTVRATPRQQISARTLLICFVVAATLLLLGGEGRLFYANTDWRVRDGVLHDLATHDWPFAYMARGLPEILRCPLGMYLLPAIAMRAGGQAAGDMALLLQNAVLLTIVFALAAPLFQVGRRRVIALIVFVAFSGLDAIGAWLAGTGVGAKATDHIEWWAAPLQYSSHVTLLFWVPQHLLAGWICALGYMLWHDRRVSLGVVLMLVPLTILWSPLAALGAMPFAIVAALTTLRQGILRTGDILLPALASVLTIPALAYLSASGDAVGGHVERLQLSNYVMFELLEVAPFLLAAFFSTVPTRFGRGSLALVAALLLALPFARVGWSSDLMMRASIPALAILAVMTAHQLGNEPSGGRRIATIALIAIGSITGLHEIIRAVSWPASPPPSCTFYGAWGRSPASHKSTYLAPVQDFPAIVRPPTPLIIPAKRDPLRCWARAWPEPNGI